MTETKFQRYSLFLILATCVLSISLKAQESERFLQRDAAQHMRTVRERQFTPKETERGGSLNLPFFDDFSRYSLPTDDPDVPDSWQLWTDNGACINNNLPVSPPTIGVATLDGLNSCGMPYNWNNAGSYGHADTLTSMPLNLGSYNAEDQVFLLFYYEPQGLGNAPEAQDSLVLEFYSPFGQGAWIHRWSVPGSNVAQFQRVQIDITEPEYLMDGFRFRFRNYATLSGNMDHWHIDYVLLDAGIAPEVCADFDEVAMQYPIRTLLNNDMTAMPWTHYKDNPASHMLASFAVYQNNLGPTENIATGWKVHYNGNLLVNNTAADVNPSANACQQITRNLFTNGFNYNAAGNDTCASFDIKVFFNPTDAHPQNDTTYFTQHLQNYYAFDDGSAERAYALNTPGASLAVRHFSQKPDSLIGLLIHWTPFETDNSQQTFFLRAWGEGGGQPGAELSDEFVFQHPTYFCDDHNVFAYHEYSNPIYVNGTFYVGWVQQGNAELNVGNDKNNDTNPTHLHYKLGIGSNWQQSGISGTVMIRPVLQSGKPGYTTLTEPHQPEFTVYPNPSSGQLHIAYGEPGEHLIQILDLQGRVVMQWNDQLMQGTHSVESLAAGTYIIEVHGPSSTTRQRFVRQ